VRLGYGKFSIFGKSVAVSQKRGKIGLRLLLIITNRKSHTRFRLASKSTTLDDLEGPSRTLLQNTRLLSHHKNLKEPKCWKPVHIWCTVMTKTWWRTSMRCFRVTRDCVTISFLCLRRTAKLRPFRSKKNKVQQITWMFCRNREGNTSRSFGHVYEYAISVRATASRGGNVPTPWRALSAVDSDHNRQVSLRITENATVECARRRRRSDVSPSAPRHNPRHVYLSTPNAAFCIDLGSTNSTKRSHHSPLLSLHTAAQVVQNEAGRWRWTWTVRTPQWEHLMPETNGSNIFS